MKQTDYATAGVKFAFDMWNVDGFYNLSLTEVFGSEDNWWAGTTEELFEALPQELELVCIMDSFIEMEEKIDEIVFWAVVYVGGKLMVHKAKFNDFGETVRDELLAYPGNFTILPKVKDAVRDFIKAKVKSALPAN